MGKNEVQTFQYLCDFHKIDEVPIYDKKTYVGRVTRNLEYRYGDAHSYYRNKDYAIRCAFTQIYDVIALKEKLDREVEVNVVEVINRETWEYDDGRGYVTHHVYPKTIAEKRDHTLRGTLDQVFEQFYVLNDRLRYCNGHFYDWGDEGYGQEYRLWLRIIPDSRHFDLYYRTGLVD